MEATPNKKVDARPGQVWKTAMGHRVRIIAGARIDVIEAAYVDGRVEGNLGINFEAASGVSIENGDALVERET